MLRLRSWHWALTETHLPYAMRRGHLPQQLLQLLKCCLYLTSFLSLESRCLCCGTWNQAAEMRSRTILHISYIQVAEIFDIYIYILVRLKRSWNIKLHSAQLAFWIQFKYEIQKVFPDTCAYCDTETTRWFKKAKDIIRHKKKQKFTLWTVQQSDGSTKRSSLQLNLWKSKETFQ